MSRTGFQHVFGPVPSRRLGRSLGLDLVPFKTCTYDCVYCQLGRTTNKTVERKAYVAIDEVMAELERKLASEDAADYVTVSGSGEPTLNSDIGELIARIKKLTEIPVAVLTNGSLLWMSEVQDALLAADLVIPSLDAGDAQLFRYVNRPHDSVSFGQMVDGISAFAERFRGEVWLEVLLLGGVTGIPTEVEKIAAAVRRIKPTRVQLNTVLRPPAEEFAFPVDADQLGQLLRFFPKPAEAISEGRSGRTRSARGLTIDDSDVLALLRRRPCTVPDVATGLGLNVSEAAKRLHALGQRGVVKTVRKDGVLFYRP